VAALGEPGRDGKQILLLRDRVGIERVLFGSNMGGIEVSCTLNKCVDQFRMFPELAKQHGSSLSQEELDLLLGGNAMRLYRLEAPVRKPAAARA
jgi:hypothetical protein